MFISNVCSPEFIMGPTYMQNLIKMKLHQLHSLLQQHEEKDKSRCYLKFPSRTFGVPPLVWMDNAVCSWSQDCPDPRKQDGVPLWSVLPPICSLSSELAQACPQALQTWWQKKHSAGSIDKASCVLGHSRQPCRLLAGSAGPTSGAALPSHLLSGTTGPSVSRCMWV